VGHKILHTCTCIRDARLHTPAFEAKGHTKLRHLMWNGRIDAPALPPGSRAARGTGHASGARSLRITSAGVAVGVTKIGVALEALNHFSYCFRGECEHNISSRSSREQERWVVLRRTGSSRKLWLKNDGSSHRRVEQAHEGARRTVLVFTHVCTLPVAYLCQGVFGNHGLHGIWECPGVGRCVEVQQHARR
jgi:hypothetical protein